MYTNKLTQDNPKKLNLTQINVAHNITTEKLNLTNKQLLGLFKCVCIALCTIVTHKTAQYRPDNFPTTLQTITITPMMTI